MLKTVQTMKELLKGTMNLFLEYELNSQFINT